MLLLNVSFILKAQDYTLVSPDKNIKVGIFTKGELKISISFLNKKLLKPSVIGMEIEGVSLGKDDKVKKEKRKTVSQTVIPEIKVKASQINENYNELTLIFAKKYSLVVRAFNEGVAYRFKKDIDKEITVLSETGNYNFSENNNCWWSKEKGFYSHNQVYFDYKALNEFTENDLASLPLIISAKSDIKVVITERF